MVSMPKFHDFLPNFQKENTKIGRIIRIRRKKVSNGFKETSRIADTRSDFKRTV